MPALLALLVLLALLELLALHALRALLALLDLRIIFLTEQPVITVFTEYLKNTITDWLTAWNQDMLVASASKNPSCKRTIFVSCPRWGFDNDLFGFHWLPVATHSSNGGWHLKCCHLKCFRHLKVPTIFWNVLDDYSYSLDGPKKFIFFYFITALM